MPSAEQNQTDTTHSKLSGNIMAIYQDRQNRYWFGSWKDGLYQYDGNTITHFTEMDGLPSNRVEEVQEDKLGNLFVNTSKGVCRYDGKRFVQLTPIPGDWSLSPDDLWFKNTETRYVYRYDGKRLYSLDVPKTALGEEVVSKCPHCPDPYHIYCHYKDKKGNIWFGTAVLGAFRYNGKSFDWISEPDVTELHNGPSNGVRSIAEDALGRFWFNTSYVYEVFDGIEAGRFHFYDRQTSIGSLDGWQDGDLNEYLSIVADNDQNLWIATYSKGVWKYDGNKIQHFPVQVRGKNIHLYCLYKDRQGSIWLGTQEEGVWKLDEGRFRRFKG